MPAYLLFGLTVGDYHMNSLDDAVELWSLLFPLRQISELEILLQVIHYLILVSLKVLELVIDRVYLKELTKSCESELGFSAVIGSQRPLTGTTRWQSRAQKQKNNFLPIMQLCDFANM